MFEDAETKAYQKLSDAALGILSVRKKPLRFIASGQADVPAAGARITIDRGEAAKRITATRVALTGIFALALKKDQTKLFITVEGKDGSVLVAECPAKREVKARKLAALVHSTYR
jgi:hypothetical protein